MSGDAGEQADRPGAVPDNAVQHYEQAWRAFLDAAARLYKYSFPEQVLIYAQEPEATACAAKEVWYTRMKRSLRPDAQAIALPDPHSHFGRLKYVFDVRETQPLPGALEFRQWSLPFEALERVTDRLGQEYGISREPVVADRVYALVMNAPRELYPMQLTAMLRAADAEGRWSGQDDAALARQFHQLVADSAAYMVGVRVGIGRGHGGRAGKHHALQQLRIGRTRGHLCQPSGRVGAAGCRTRGQGKRQACISGPRRAE